MYFLTLTISCGLCLLLQSTPVELIPVDAGVEDRTVLSESLRVEPYDMRENQSFEQLFRVEGSPQIYVRRAGSLHAVFRDPLYVETVGGSIPLVPTSTIYCIGEVTHNVLNQLGVIATGEKVIVDEGTSVQEIEKWNPVSPAISHTPLISIRFLDDEGYRRRRLASFVLEMSFRR
jgi:hypothetical protein